MTSVFAISLARDLWDWLALWAIVAAAVAAAVGVWFARRAIKRGNEIAANADKALARERRDTYELGLLDRLWELLCVAPPGADKVIPGLLERLEPEDVPQIRDSFRQNVFPSNEQRALYAAEFNEAVQRRLEKPSIVPVDPTPVRDWLRKTFRRK
jgi:hypothetical protein